MKNKIFVLILMLFVFLSGIVLAKDVHVKGYTRKDGTYVAPHTRSSSGLEEHRSTPNNGTYNSNVQRDEKGHIKRSQSAKNTFMKSTGYPNGRKGYVVDHKIPLACGGSDTPSNMQWQTIEEGKAKDKWERKGCK
jgi:hypothetical protein